MEVAGIIIGLLGLFVAIYGTKIASVEYQKRHRMEDVFKTITQNYPGEVAKLHQNCHDGNTNVRDAVDLMKDIPESDAKHKLIKILTLASGHTMASKSGCISLFSKLLTDQKAQFGTREIDHPQRDILELCKEEARNYPPQPPVEEKKPWYSKLF